jgi:hypothetical protein
MLVALPTALLPLLRSGNCLLGHCTCYVNYGSLITDSLKLQVIHDRFGIIEGLMTTVHSITGMALPRFSFLFFGKKEEKPSSE